MIIWAIVLRCEWLLDYKQPGFIVVRDSIFVENIYSPMILAAEKDFLIVFKPPGMHSAPLPKSGGGTMLDWCCLEFPEVGSLTGRREGEGGLLHRLDYETHGIMLLARTREGMESLLLQQMEGKIAKKYSAMTTKTETKLPGFPDSAFDSLTIKSAFRAYGVGRKAVRPAPEGKKEYTTEVLSVKELGDNVYFFTTKILSGFRHQIRCHLAWAGYPIVNDKLYGGSELNDGCSSLRLYGWTQILGLRASSIAFADPSTGEKQEYSINLTNPTDKIPGSARGRQAKLD